MAPRAKTKHRLVKLGYAFAIRPKCLSERYTLGRREAMSRSANGSLFPPTYRLVGVCLLVGILGGFAALIFDFLVELAQSQLLNGLAGYMPPPVGTLTATLPLTVDGSLWWIPVSTTLGGLIGGILVYRLAPEAEGHGTDAAVAAYHQKGGVVRRRVPPVKAVASAITIGSGGVAGREGPTAQIAVGLGAAAAEWLGFRGQERRIILLASMAGGLAAVFRAPLGMAIFAVEILYSDMVFESEALIYTVISAVTAYALHGFFVGWSPIFATPEGLAFHSPSSLVAYAVLGVLSGLLGAGLPTLFYGLRDLFRKLPLPSQFKPAVGGLGLGLIGMAFPPLLGTGYGWIEAALAEKLSLVTITLILLLKPPAMSLTIASGGSGGVFGPTIVAGGMLGALFGQLAGELFPFLELNVPSMVLVGMAATFAGAARTPISTLIMVAEMTGGYGLIVPSMLANILSFLIQRSVTAGARYPTLYVSQVHRREDSPVHKGVFVRRALRMIEDRQIDAADVSLPRLVSLLQYGEPVEVSMGGGMLVQVLVRPGSELAGTTVAESFAKLEDVTALALIRGPQMLVPRGPTVIKENDQLIAVASRPAYRRLQELADAARMPSADSEARRPPDQT